MHGRINGFLIHADERGILSLQKTEIPQCSLTVVTRMVKPEVKKILQQFTQGKLGEQQVVDAISDSLVERMGFAALDHHREHRQGFPEVIFCEGKTERQVAEIARRIVRHGSVLFATRATKKQYSAVKKKVSTARYNELARTISANENRVKHRGRGTILVVTAGTSDLPVAEEAYETAKLMGNDVDRLTGVGVAGIHRILTSSNKLRAASVIIVVAGMDGALPALGRVPGPGAGCFWAKS